MRISLLLLSTAVTLTCVAAQSPTPASPSGRLVDARSGEPVQGALVRGGPYTTTTDVMGGFTFDTVVDSVHITHIGYESVTMPWAEVIDLQPRALLASEVIVRAGLTRERLSQTTAGVDVVEARQLAGQRHLQDLTDGMANVHWAGGTSRPRYFQIRGIGERSQFAGEGPPSFAVGFVVDDVELSGLGTAAMLFDMDQVEIFKGPQSTVFGPDAMAGLISMRSADPGGQLRGQLQTGIGEDGHRSVGAAVSVPLAERWAARLSYGGQRTNGFRQNEYLEKDDTNERREQTLRAKLQFDGEDEREATVTLFRSEADNGYDAWSPDNNGDFLTYSDNPGRDEQKTSGGSLRLQWPVSGQVDVLSISSVSVSDLEYSYDGDWGNDSFWAASPYDFDAAVEGWSYDFFDRTQRERITWTQEVRLLTPAVVGLGGDGVIGLYTKQLREEDVATGYLFGGDAADLESRFDIDNVALYGQWQRPLPGAVQLLVNVRADRHGTSYRGTSNEGADLVRFSTDGWLAGGRLALSRGTSLGRLFIALSRGYRPGGINQHPRLSAANRPYDAETVWNTEAGLRTSGDRMQTSLTLFHARRQDQQVELSSQQDPGDPNSFVFFSANAARGWNAGAEVEASYRLTEGLRLQGTAGWLLTHTDAYSFETASGEMLTLGDREAAHAPTYSFRIGADYEHRSGALAAFTWTATDEFYYSDSHDFRASSQQQLHTRIGYRARDWSIRLWARNLLDERFTTRGFYFGLEPPLYQSKLYVTHGDPRQLGVTLRVELGTR